MARTNVHKYFDEHKVEFYARKHDEQRQQIEKSEKVRMTFQETIKVMLENQDEFMESIIAENKLKVLISQKDIK